METEKAAFMGRITAGVTHEIKNVLAIIKESAGLLEDLVCLSKEDAPPPRDKLLRAVGRITDQVSRGVDLAVHLNAFAHTPDEKTAGVDLNQAAAQAAYLSQRFARLKGMTLTTAAHERALTITIDPLAFQLLLFQAVEWIMDLAAPGTVITLEPTADQGKRIVISTVGAGEPMKSVAQTETPLWTALQATARSLNINIETGGPLPWISVG
jgi:C4-dicarboxylate-specific signal transduction histidine kinase